MWQIYRIAWRRRCLIQLIKASEENSANLLKFHLLTVKFVVSLEKAFTRLLPDIDISITNFFSLFTPKHHSLTLHGRKMWPLNKSCPTGLQLFWFIDQESPTSSVTSAGNLGWTGNINYFHTTKFTVKSSEQMVQFRSWKWVSSMAKYHNPWHIVLTCAWPGRWSFILVVLLLRGCIWRDCFTSTYDSLFCLLNWKQIHVF